MTWLSRLTLTQKLLGALAIPLVLAFGVLAVVVQQQLSREVPPIVESGAERQVAARAGEIHRWIGGYRQWLAGVATDDRLAEPASVDSLLPWLESRFPGDDAIESFYLADARGNFITHTGASGSIAERDYFRTLVTEGSADSLLADPVISLVSGEPTAVIAQPRFDERGRRIGLIGITLSMAAVSEITTAISAGEGSYGYLVDSSGMIVAHPDASVRMSLNVTQADAAGFQGANRLGAQMLEGVAGSGERRDPDGQRVTMVWHPVGDAGWTLAMSVPSRLFSDVTQRLVQSLLVVGAVVLAALLLIVGLTARRSLSPIRQTAMAMADIAQGKGDLTRRLEAKSQDEVGELATQFNAFVERMQATLTEVRDSAHSVLLAAGDIADGTQELSSRTEQAAANLQETSASMEEIHSTVAHTAQSSEQANALAHGAADAAERGRGAMGEMETKMQAISGSATQISEIIGLIDAIAFQTNILALNASVEAARAGEHGRGFAVVAQEVRSLSSRSADAAKEIRELINASVAHSREGSELVTHVAERMQEIHRIVVQVSDVIGEITAGTREQTTGITQVNTAVAEMDAMTQQNASMVSQNAALAGGMRSRAESLVALMGEFVLDSDNPASRRVMPRRLSAPVAVVGGDAAASPRVRETAPARQAEAEWEEF